LSGCQSFEEHRQSFEKYFNHLVFDRPPSIV
jgi:hypothetical protein